MDFSSPEIYQWFRVCMWSILAMLTFYNAARFKGLMKLWFLFLALMFVNMSITVFLHLVDSPDYDKYVNGVFSPIVVVLVVLAIAFIINNHLK